MAQSISNLVSSLTQPRNSAIASKVKGFSSTKPATGIQSVLSKSPDYTKYVGGLGTTQTAAQSPQKVVSSPTSTVVPKQALETTNQGVTLPTKTTTTANPTRGLLTFPSIVENIQQASRPSQTQQGLVKDIRTTAQGFSPIGDEARRISDEYAREIARVGQLGAGAVAGNLSTGTNVVGQGNAAIASQSASQRMQALSAAQQAALEGTGQQLTAQAGAGGLLGSALTGATNLQAQQLSGLGAAAGFAQPSVAQYGQTVFNPLTGGYSRAGGNLDPQVQAQNLAQQVISGGMTYDQALASLGYAGQAGTNFLNNAITAAGGSPLQLQQLGASQQANIATQTTAATDIARQGLQEATQNYVNLGTNAQYAHKQASAVSDILAKTGLNNISSTDYNKALRGIQQRFSDEDRTALNTALLEAQNAYTLLLSSTGGTPSGRESQALNSLNIDASAAAINASIQELESAVARRLQAQYGALQQYEQSLMSGNTRGSPTSGVITWDQL